MEGELTEVFLVDAGADQFVRNLSLSGLEVRIIPFFVKQETTYVLTFIGWILFNSIVFLWHLHHIRYGYFSHLVFIPACLFGRIS